MEHDCNENDDCFKKGALVEVSLEEEGFRGSWYTATVLRPLSASKKTNKENKKKIFLEFHTLMSDDKATKPLREHVDIILVRPLPPRESKPTFNLSDEVDAFHNDGWWEGVITDVLHPASASFKAGPTRYSVFFRSSREQIEFPESDLRLHREWVYGKWVPPLQAEAVTAPAPPVQLKHHQPQPNLSPEDALSLPSSPSVTSLPSLTRSCVGRGGRGGFLPEFSPSRNI